MKILAINCGSSSVKAELFDATGFAESEQHAIWSGRISGVETDNGEISVRAPGKRDVLRSLGAVGFETAIKMLLNLMWTGASSVIKGPIEIQLIGHRIVHGGTEFRESVRITDAVVHRLAALSDLAPLHQARCLHGISACKALFQHATQVAVFDTAFHSGLPPEGYMYAVPHEWYQEHGIRRYGFHGISHAYASKRTLALAGLPVTGSKLITCHLGSGCSITAVADGKSVRTTMGYTPMEGLVMGTRSGSIDPGIILHLLERRILTADKLDHALNHSSGLAGVSGVSSDMRELQASAAGGDTRSKLAIDLFVESVASHAASMLPALGGVDAITFTGGIGENASAIREAVCKQMAFLGLAIDSNLDASSDKDRIISTSSSKVAVCVVKAQEETEIAHQALVVAPLGLRA
jgi:acetate kinase